VFWQAADGAADSPCPPHAMAHLMPVKSVAFTLPVLAGLFALALQFSTALHAQELPPTEVAYVDQDPAAQRIQRIDANDRSMRSTLEGAIRKDPGNAMLKLQNAALLADRGIRLRVARELSAAARASDEGSLNLRVVHYNAGWILFDIGDYDGAQAHWMDALRLHGGQPDWVPAAFAILQWTRGYPQQAADYYAAAARSMPQRWGDAAGVEAATATLDANQRFTLQSLFGEWQLNQR